MFSIAEQSTLLFAVPVFSHGCSRHIIEEMRLSGSRRVMRPTRSRASRLTPVQRSSGYDMTHCLFFSMICSTLPAANGAVPVSLCRGGIETGAVQNVEDDAAAENVGLEVVGRLVQDLRRSVARGPAAQCLLLLRLQLNAEAKVDYLELEVRLGATTGGYKTAQYMRRMFSGFRSR